VRLFLHELAAQQRLYWRSREAAFFTFLMPLIFLVLIGSVYGSSTVDGIRGSTYLLAGLLGYSVIATAFAGLAITLVVRRESGVLKRVRGTPLPTETFLASVIGSTLVVIALGALAQVVVGRFVVDAGWPERPAELALALLVGAACFAALGLALTGVIRSAEGSSALVNAIYLPLVFVSGVFFSVNELPGFFQAVAEISPLTYLLRLVRECVVAGGEGLAGSLEALAVLAGWGIAGLLLAVRMFRWEPREA
jgi:ABC-2 type transport system permease protein